jgi:hypothetical protein
MGGLPAWGMGAGLTTLHGKKNSLATKHLTKSRTWTDSNIALGKLFSVQVFILSIH